MFDSVSIELINLARFLLPGFLAAWIFYGLTSHPKPSQFERMIQALIFTFIVQVLTYPLSWILLAIGNYIQIRAWDETSEAVAALVLACILGITIAYYANNDKAHRYFRRIGFTTRTSHPSEWYYVFAEKVTFVILHLNDGRRLYGWPKEWPIESGKGQFYIMAPSWIDEDGKELPLPGVGGILMPASEVRWVEFIDLKGELTHD
ncbi:MAG: DUF6338 family protein [Gammaproteobacteria bacterium]|nr:DUF6338 family protein [Gammaproteobacteria bacterium]